MAGRRRFAGCEIFLQRRRGRWHPQHRPTGISNRHPRINPMHHPGRMIHEPHCLALREPGAMTSGNKRNPTRMTRCPTCFLELIIESEVHFSGERRNRSIRTSFFDLPKIPGELITHRHHKKLARILELALRVLNQNRLLTKINPIPRNTGLCKSTSQMNQDLKNDRHPSVLFASKSRASKQDVRIAQILLFLRGSDHDARQPDHVAVSKLPADRFADDKGQELYLHARRVVAGPLFLAPNHVSVGVLILDLPRVTNPMIAQPFVKALPNELVPLQGIRIAIMSIDVRRSPNAEFLTSGGANLSLFAGSLDHLATCRPSVGFAINAKFQAFILPPSGVDIAIAKIPVRRTFNFFQGSHIKLGSSLLFPTNIANHAKYRQKGTGRGLNNHSLPQSCSSGRTGDISKKRHLPVRKIWNFHCFRQIEKRAQSLMPENKCSPQSPITQLFLTRLNSFHHRKHMSKIPKTSLPLHHEAIYYLHSERFTTQFPICFPKGRGVLRLERRQSARSLRPAQPFSSEDSDRFNEASKTGITFPREGMRHE